MGYSQAEHTADRLKVESLRNLTLNARGAAPKKAIQGRARLLRALRQGRDPVLSRRLRGLLRRDDLVGGAAGEFGHVVELRRESADARGCRPDLDDEIA